MEDLPNIALHNILSRLPIQLLMQYRTVCKSWLRLIDHPYFQKDLHSEEPVMAFGCIYGEEGNGPTIYKVTRKGEEMRAVELKSFPELGLFRHQYSDKMRSCNGFILFERLDEYESCLIEIAVVNPLTKEIVRVPGSPYQTVFFHNMSLGFDPSTSTYKLVQLLVLDHQDELAAAIYDLRSGCWRCCNASSAGFLYYQDDKICSGVCISGTLNWVYQGSDGGHLVSFDLGREEFSVVYIPVDLSEFSTRVELIDMGGLIGLCEMSTPESVEIWVLHEMSTHSWIRKLSIFMDVWVALTDNIHEVYCYQDSLVFLESRQRVVVKRKRNGKKKISGKWELRFVHHDLNNKLPRWDVKDELPQDLHVYCTRLNLSRLVDEVHEDAACQRTLRLIP